MQSTHFVFRLWTMSAADAPIVHWTEFVEQIYFLSSKWKPRSLRVCSLRALLFNFLNLFAKLCLQIATTHRLLMRRVQGALSRLHSRRPHLSVSNRSPLDSVHHLSEIIFFAIYKMPPDDQHSTMASPGASSCSSHLVELFHWFCWEYSD